MQKKIDWPSVGIVTAALVASPFIFKFGFENSLGHMNDAIQTQKPTPTIAIETPMPTPKLEIEIQKPIPTVAPTPTPTPIPTPEIEIEEPKAFYPLTDEERTCVEYIVSGEAGHEPLEGKMAVAQCILNAAIQDDISPIKVRTKYHYRGWKEDLKSNYPDDFYEVEEAVSRVFDDGEKVTEENILWFYAPKYSEGKFHNTQKFVMKIGGHKFFAPWN